MVEPTLIQSQEQRLQMVLAPQLRQSLEMLQVPVLELRSLVQQEMERNPTLEEKASRDEKVEIEPGSAEPERTEELDFKEEFEVLARLDDEWREYFHQNQSVQPYTADDAARRQFLLDSITQPPSLQDHLLSQLKLAGLTPEDERLGELLIGSINSDGYLTASLEELAGSTGHAAGELEQVLRQVQEFDPIGVGARDLRECLLLQLRRIGRGQSPAALMVERHLELLGARKYAQIARALKLPLEEVQQQARLIATLEPRPGRLITAETPAYVLPEVVVQKVGSEYLVLMDRDLVPHLRISRHYRQLMEDPATSAEVKGYIREKVRAGAFLIKSIHQRQQTIYNIAREIVRVQHGFLDHGISHLRPLTMAEVAARLGIHETTVSRAVANKYLQTPRGTFEMKYFFTPGYKTSSGEDVSNKTIKGAISRLIAGEMPGEPLSDQAVVEILKEQGITVARRTIAKYRDELHILPSHLRKSF